MLKEKFLFYLFTMYVCNKGADWHTWTFTFPTENSILCVYMCLTYVYNTQKDCDKIQKIFIWFTIVLPVAVGMLPVVSGFLRIFLIQHHIFIYNTKSW